MSTANDVLRREAEWKAHLEICDCQIYRGESRELTPEAQVYYTKQAAAASELAEEVDELRHALDAQAAATLIEIDLLRQEHERALNAQHDRIESALSAALGDPDLGAYPGDPDGAPDLESLIAMVAGLRRQRDEARRERDEMAAAGRAVVEATDEMRAQWAEIEARLEAEKATLSSEVAALRVWVGHHRRDPQMLADAQHEHGLLSERVTDLQDENARLYDALESARLTLLAEQGKPEGAASERWHVSYDLFDFCWWRGEDDEPPEVECHLSGGDWRWTKPGFESNPYPTALDCMNAADQDSP